MPKIFRPIGSMDDLEGFTVIAPGMSPWAPDPSTNEWTPTPSRQEGNKDSTAGRAAAFGQTHGACIRNAREEIHEALCKAMQEGGGSKGSGRRKPACLSPILITSPILSPTLSRTSSTGRSPMRSPVLNKKKSSTRIRSPSDRRRSLTSPRQPSQFKKQASRRTHSSSHDQADEAMRLIEGMRNGLLRRLKSSNFVLTSAQHVVDQCGDAIFLWFGSLSGPALEAEIQKTFARFDTDASGQINRQEFANAMHTLGLRLKADEYDLLFQEYDVDQSGEIDLAEFTHMIKTHIKKRFKSSFEPCERKDASDNQQGDKYRCRWADNEALLVPAASKLQSGVLAALARREYTDLVAQSCEHNRADVGLQGTGGTDIHQEASQMSAYDNVLGDPPSIVECLKAKLPPPRYPAGQDGTADDKASQHSADALSVARRPSSAAQKEMERKTEAGEAWLWRQDEASEKRRGSLNDEAKTSWDPYAYAKAGEAELEGTGSCEAFHPFARPTDMPAHMSAAAVADGRRLSLCGVWHKANEKWEGGPLRALAAKPTANDMQHLAQPSHRRFELTATAKHANSPLAQVKAYNSKVLQSVQSSHNACRDDKMLRPVRNSVEVQPLSSAKPSRKLSLDGFLEMCKSKSGTVSRGAHTDRTGEGRKMLAIYRRASCEVETHITKAAGAGSCEEGAFFTRALSDNGESTPLLSFRDTKAAGIWNRCALERSAPFLRTLAPRTRDVDSKFVLPAIGDKSDQLGTGRRHSDEERGSEMEKGGAWSTSQTKSCTASSNVLLTKHGLQPEPEKRKPQGRVLSITDDFLVLAKGRHDQRLRQSRGDKLQTPW